MSYKKEKKSLASVIATALLILVAVGTIIGFQTWFETYSTGLFTKTEQSSSVQVSNTKIESVIGDSLYFNNGNFNNLSIISVKIEGVDCNVGGNYSSGINELNLSSCISNVSTSTPEIVVYTNQGIYAKNFFRKEPVNTPSLNPPLELNSSFAGNLTWNRSFDTTYDEYPGDIEFDNFGNIYVAFDYSDGSGSVDLLVKYDSQGNILWNKTLYNDLLGAFSNDLFITSTNEVFLCGEVFTGVNYDVYFVKYDVDGNLMLNSTFDSGGYNDFCKGIVVDSLGNIYLGGDAGGIWKMQLVKFNSSGNLLWNKTFSPIGYIAASGEDLGIDQLNNLYLGGFCEATDYDMCLFKFNSDGEEIWNLTYSNGNYEAIHALDLDLNNNIYVAGFITNTNNDYSVRKYDSNGNYITSFTYDSNLNDIIYDIEVDSVDTFFVTGKILNGANFDFFTLKYNLTSEEIVWNSTIDLGDADMAYGLDYFNSTLCIVGETYDMITSNTLILKYN